MTETLCARCVVRMGWDAWRLVLHGEAPWPTWAEAITVRDGTALCGAHLMEPPPPHVRDEGWPE